MSILGAVAEGGLRFGLLVSAFLFGFRHGIDWDHIAAITDITSSQEERQRALFFGTLYAVGHAIVVFTLGVIAIVVGRELPESIDTTMTRIVGVTLILLGVYVFYSLAVHGREFRMRSRWMMIFAGARKLFRWVRSLTKRAPVHERPIEEAETPAAWHHGHHGLPGHHHHDHSEQDDAFLNYGKFTAFIVGMIHGVGAETPTQVVIFLTAARAGGTGAGLVVLLAFIVGLLSSNSLITIGSAMGFLGASKNFALYATVAVLTGFFSLFIGVLFVIGKETFLPAFFGG